MEKGSDKIKRVAVIGTRGVPASYGGFESLVENLLGENCPENVKYTVFCSGKDMPEKLPAFRGADLRYVGLHANGIQSVPYDVISMCRALAGYDVMLILGVSGCLFLPIVKALFRGKIIVNIDGMEHRRAKWGKAARWLLRNSEAMAVRFADVVVADNKGIQDYVLERYGKNVEMIAYGGDNVCRNLSDAEITRIINGYGLTAKDYAITVCRIEPENNSHMILDAFARSGDTLVFVGNWGRNEYSSELRRQYSSYPNIHLLDAIYDLEVLYALRKSARCYVHGHSAGGTNPSLVEAMFFGNPILAYDVVFNRETTCNKAYYFKNADELIDLLHQPGLEGETMEKIAGSRYQWRQVSQQYCNLY